MQTLALRTYSNWLIAGFFALLSSLVHAQQFDLLSPEQAFTFSVESVAPNQAQLNWTVPNHYYLYAQQFAVKQDQQSIPFKLPAATALHDENFGEVDVYLKDIHFDIQTEPEKNYVVTWQGCAKDRICYPPQTAQFQTDANGLVIQNQNNQLLQNRIQLSQKPIDVDLIQNQNEVAKDQFWSEKLAQNSWIYSVFLFFGLGILLAFTPCSLPMLPILTSLLIREHKGLKAWSIALVFVVSMATVYAILGFIVSSAGLNFQRWLQQPLTLVIFSTIFIVFALNLFGVFELRLPQGLTHQLDKIQGGQQGGNLFGAAIMGMISALLVGPCMTAPLAGALLFISQTQSQIQGAILLFALGFGMGTPLLLASILGSKVLPQAGQWMNQIKILFAFVMLALALYFVRPLLSDIWFQVGAFSLSLALLIYLIIQLKNQQKKWAYFTLLLLFIPYFAYSQYQYSQTTFLQTQVETAQWHVAHNATEFAQLLEKAPKNQKIIVDVYADWCIACQPIEHKILKSAQVQAQLAPFYLIKLDLSHYDASHQNLLNQFEILGPPTYLFLDETQQEVRGLRLTGAFSETELLSQLQKH